jgi:hypothetical protein
MLFIAQTNGFLSKITNGIKQIQDIVASKNEQKNDETINIEKTITNYNKNNKENTNTIYINSDKTTDEIKSFMKKIPKNKDYKEIDKMTIGTKNKIFLIDKYDERNLNEQLIRIDDRTKLNIPKRIRNIFVGDTNTNFGEAIKHLYIDSIEDVIGLHIINPLTILSLENVHIRCLFVANQIDNLILKNTTIDYIIYTDENTSRINKITGKPLNKDGAKSLMYIHEIKENAQGFQDKITEFIEPMYENQLGELDGEFIDKGAKDWESISKQLYGELYKEKSYNNIGHPKHEQTPIVPNNSNNSNTSNMFNTTPKIEQFKTGAKSEIMTSEKKSATTSKVKLTNAPANHGRKIETNQLEGQVILPESGAEDYEQPDPFDTNTKSQYIKSNDNPLGEHVMLPKNNKHNNEGKYKPAELLDTVKSEESKKDLSKDNNTETQKIDKFNSKFKEESQYFEDESQSSIDDFDPTSSVELNDENPDAMFSNINIPDLFNINPSNITNLGNTAEKPSETTIVKATIDHYNNKDEEHQNNSPQSIGGPGIDSSNKPESLEEYSDKANNPKAHNVVKKQLFNAQKTPSKHGSSQSPKSAGEISDNPSSYTIDHELGNESALIFIDEQSVHSSNSANGKSGEIPIQSNNKLKSGDKLIDPNLNKIPLSKITKSNRPSSAKHFTNNQEPQNQNTKFMDLNNSNKPQKSQQLDSNPPSQNQPVELDSINGLGNNQSNSASKYAPSEVKKSASKSQSEESIESKHILQNSPNAPNNQGIPENPITSNKPLLHNSNKIPDNKSSKYSKAPLDSKPENPPLNSKHSKILFNPKKSSKPVKSSVSNKIPSKSDNDILSVTSKKSTKSENGHDKKSIKSQDSFSASASSKSHSSSKTSSVKSSESNHSRVSSKSSIKSNALSHSSKTSNTSKISGTPIPTPKSSKNKTPKITIHQQESSGSIAITLILTVLLIGFIHFNSEIIYTPNDSSIHNNKQLDNTINNPDADLSKYDSILQTNLDKLNNYNSNFMKLDNLNLSFSNSEYLGFSNSEFITKTTFDDSNIDFSNLEFITLI